MNATRRFADLIDESTLIQMGKWRRPWSDDVLLKQLAHDRAGFPDELLEAIELATVRRLKINAARGGHRRGVQIRNGPLLTVMDSLMLALVGLTVSVMTVAFSAATPGLLAIIASLGLTVASLMVLGFATWWIPAYLSFLDALDDSLNRRPARWSWFGKKAPAPH